MSDVSACGTDEVFVAEDFWFIAAIMERKWTRNPEHRRMRLTSWSKASVTLSVGRGVLLSSFGQWRKVQGRLFCKCW